MDTTDIRRIRLQQLIDKYGTQAEFIRVSGQNQSEVSGLLKNKSFGEKKARKIEVDLDLPRGWLDVPLDVERISEPLKNEPPPPPLARTRKWSGLPDGPAMDTSLKDWRARASPKSREVIDNLIQRASNNDFTEQQWEIFLWLAEKYSQKNQ